MVFEGSRSFKLYIRFGTPVDVGWLLDVGASSLRVLGNHTHAPGRVGTMHDSRGASGGPVLGKIKMSVLEKTFFWCYKKCHFGFCVIKSATWDSPSSALVGSGFLW